MEYLAMFWSFFKTGLFTIGGGYAMIPLITQELTSHGWMTAKQVADVIAIAEMTPGAFAVNSATFAGMKVLGLPGAVVCTFGVALPSLIITTLAAKFFFSYNKAKYVQGVFMGIRPVVVALIAAAAVKFALSNLFTMEFDVQALGAFLRSVDVYAVLIMALAVAALLWKKINPILVVLGCAAAGIVLYYIAPLVL